MVVALAWPPTVSVAGPDGMPGARNRNVPFLSVTVRNTLPATWRTTSWAGCEPFPVSFAVAAGTS